MRESYWASCGMKSEYADMKNTGGRGGGSITAALFLKRFIEKEETKWAHLDIAGPVWDDKKGGATGFGANTLARWIAGQGVRATQCGMNSLSRSDRTRDDGAAARDGRRVVFYESISNVRFARELRGAPPPVPSPRGGPKAKK